MYSEEQVEAVLKKCNVKIATDTYTNFLCFCPVHGNKHTPSLSVDKATGAFICFNPACGVDGNLQRLVRLTIGGNPFTILRIIDQAKSDIESDIEKQLSKVLEAPPDLVEYDQGHLDWLEEQFWKSEAAQEYMEYRGFNEHILRIFGIGYDPTKNMITVPMHNFKGKPLGFVGRACSRTDKTFKNTKKLPRRHTLFNLHRALKAGDTVIVVESSFDVMRLTQAGFPNCVAILGGAYSEDHERQLRRYFNRIIIMTDDDKNNLIRYPNCRKCVKEGGLEYCQGHNPGRQLGRKIADTMIGKEVLWASYEDSVIFPHDAKDVGDMSDDEIRQCVRNAVTTYEYESFDIDFRD